MADAPLPDAPITSAVTTPQSMPPLEPEERVKSINVTLADLTAKGTALYAHKNYEEAAEVYAHAAEMQAELNGEMDPKNADILFLYGRSLFKVGQSQSNVLGGRASGEERKKKPNPTKVSDDSKKVPAGSESTECPAVEDEGLDSKKMVGDALAAVASNTALEAKNGQNAQKPHFQFSGDETFEESDGEGGPGGEGDDDDGGEEEGESDDLATAFEILELARVLFEQSLAQGHLESIDPGREANAGESPVTRHVKERLSEVHGLLAEISLENEKYPVAVHDSRASLHYKLDLYPFDSEIVAEAHYKLSLALEFASVTTTSEESKDGERKAFDQGMRDEACLHMERAIQSTKLKLQAKEVEVAVNHDPDDNDATRRVIADVKEMISDMEDRLVELRKPPMDVDSMLGDANPVNGLLGALAGSSSAEADARVEEAKKNATDLSGLVRKKEKPSDTNGKRKAEESVDTEDMKKPRVDEPPTES